MIARVNDLRGGEKEMKESFCLSLSLPLLYHNHTDGVNESCVYLRKNQLTFPEMNHLKKNRK